MTTPVDSRGVVGSVVREAEGLLPGEAVVEAWTEADDALLLAVTAGGAVRGWRREEAAWVACGDSQVVSSEVLDAHASHPWQTNPTIVACCTGGGVALVVAKRAGDGVEFSALPLMRRRVHRVVASADGFWVVPTPGDGLASALLWAFATRRCVPVVVCGGPPADGSGPLVLTSSEVDGGVLTVTPGGAVHRVKVMDAGKGVVTTTQSAACDTCGWGAAVRDQDFDAVCFWHTLWVRRGGSLHAHDAASGVRLATHELALDAVTPHGSHPAPRFWKVSGLPGAVGVADRGSSWHIRPLQPAAVVETLLAAGGDARPAALASAEAVCHQWGDCMADWLCRVLLAICNHAQWKDGGAMDRLGATLQSPAVLVALSAQAGELPPDDLSGALQSFLEATSFKDGAPTPQAAMEAFTLLNAKLAPGVDRLVRSQAALHAASIKVGAGKLAATEPAAPAAAPASRRSLLSRTFPWPQLSVFAASGAPDGDVGHRVRAALLESMASALNLRLPTCVPADDRRPLPPDLTRPTHGVAYFEALVRLAYAVDAALVPDVVALISSHCPPSYKTISMLSASAHRAVNLLGGAAVDVVTVAASASAAPRSHTVRALLSLPPVPPQLPPVPGTKLQAHARLLVAAGRHVDAARLLLAHGNVEDAMVMLRRAELDDRGPEWRLNGGQEQAPAPTTGEASERTLTPFARKPSLRKATRVATMSGSPSAGGGHPAALGSQPASTRRLALYHEALAAVLVSQEKTAIESIFRRMPASFNLHYVLTELEAGVRPKPAPVPAVAPSPALQPRSLFGSEGGSGRRPSASPAAAAACPVFARKGVDVELSAVLPHFESMLARDDIQVQELAEFWARKGTERTGGLLRSWSSEGRAAGAGVSANSTPHPAASSKTWSGARSRVTLA